MFQSFRDDRSSQDAKKIRAEAIGVNAEDASRTRIDYLTEFALAAKKRGADRIRYCDTLRL